MFDKTFENLLKGLDAKSDLNPLHSSIKKFDITSRIQQYAQGERDFIKLASEIDTEMRSKVSFLNASKSPLQPILNDALIRKPKRQADKSTLSNEARTSFVDLFDRMNGYWEISESKRKVTQLFDIKLEGGEKDPNNTGTPSQGPEDRSLLARNRKSSQFKLSPKGQHLNTHQMVTGEEATSPVEGAAKTSLSKSYGKFLSVDTNTDKNKSKSQGENEIGFERKNTPGILKEDSLDTSHNFNLFKPAASLTQISASRDTLDRDDQEKEEEARELERIKQEEEKRKQDEEEAKAKREEEENRKKEEILKKKVEGYMKKIPDYSYMFASEIIEKNPDI